MTTAIIPDLQASLAIATGERRAAEERERQCHVLLEMERGAASAAARRRLELADAVDAAADTVETAAARLGECRSSLATVERQAEVAADAAAGGSAGGERTLAKAGDALDTLARLTAAHERRAGAAQAVVDAAEAALVAFDREQATRIGEQLEELILASAALADARIGEVAAHAGHAFELVDSRRALDQPREAWPIGCLLEGARFNALLAAFERGTWTLNSARRAVGLTRARSLADTLRTDVKSWQHGRRAPETDPEAA